MLAEKFRGVFDKIFTPLIVLLNKLGISPNMLTLTSIILLIPTIYFLINHNLFRTGIMFLIIILIDGLDGLLAKISNRKSKFGEFLDAFTDRVIEGFVFLGIALGFPELTGLAFLALILSYLVSYSAARAESWTMGKIRVRYTGVGSRGERVIVLALALFLNQLFYGLLIICLLAGIGMLNRLIIIKKTLGN